MLASILTFLVILMETALSKLISGSNNIYNLKGQVLINSSIILEDESVIITDSIIINTNITINGNKHNSAEIKNCTLEGSWIAINSIGNCTIESSHFKAKQVGITNLDSYAPRWFPAPEAEYGWVLEHLDEGQSQHMLRASNTDYLFVSHATFAGNDKEATKTELGIEMTNVTYADITQCKFTQLRSEIDKGSVLYATFSEVNMRNCQIISNMAGLGVIHATYSSKITNHNCSYSDNKSFGIKFFHSVEKCIIYVNDSCSLRNEFCMFDNNRGRPIIISNYSNFINIESRFIKNRGAILMRYFVNCTNINCSFIECSDSHGVFQFEDNVISQYVNCLFHNNSGSDVGCISSDEVEDYPEYFNILIDRCIFSYNRVTIGSGAAMFIPLGDNHKIECIIRNSTFDSNFAKKKWWCPRYNWTI